MATGYRTRAGILWTRESLFVSAKVVSAKLSEEYFPGYAEQELRENWTAIVAGKPGFFGKRHAASLEERVCLMLPDFREKYNRASEHKHTMGETLLHRASHTIVKDETRLFKNTSWRPFYNMLERHCANGCCIEPEDRYAAHEQQVLTESKDNAGVYVRVSPSGDGWFRMGMAKAIGKRDHNNSSLFLTRVYETTTPAVAAMLEKSLFERIESTGVIERRKIPEGPIGGQGALQVCRGVDIVEILDSIVDGVYKNFCRNKVGPTNAN